MHLNNRTIIKITDHSNNSDFFTRDNEIQAALSRCSLGISGPEDARILRAEIERLRRLTDGRH